MGDEPVEPTTQPAEMLAFFSPLARYSELNPQSQVKQINNGGFLNVQKPWNDPTVTFIFSKDDTAMLEALNAIHLPPIFLAIWHSDTQDLEFIWSSIPGDSDIINRSFRFDFRGKQIRCEWAKSSDRLITITNRSYITEQSSPTMHRNLGNFKLGLKYRSDHPQEFPDGATPPTSFWIRDVEWNENYLVDLTKHVNFYSLFYDRRTPIVVLVEEGATPAPVNLSRYPQGPFPSIIRSAEIDPYLLNLWMNCFRDDTIRRILHSYQILEWAGYYYIKDDNNQKIRRILQVPNALDQMEGTIMQIIEILTPTANADDAKMKQVIRERIKPEVLWRWIEPYKEWFCKTVKLDGDYELKALIDESDTVESFGRGNWHDNFYQHWTSLRNGIVHAREHRQANSISPTRENLARLHPWAELSVAAAEQIMIFRD